MSYKTSLSKSLILTLSLVTAVSVIEPVTTKATSTYIQAQTDWYTVELNELFN
ncbi:hypothetical protein [Halalkalibacter nanhaiisediminis]|uniref:Uncharacterized protein n=1 Tax=Halalkalibacter nanhaiisediminis TaxID=688079 RepID=A0A562QSV8_9BACI|nr:hypothetical protein [Halalkalibacter nanhaiisediminis]TWI59824.1 hypothetical protein IQ10_00246 [Halalkalibacter nanhaiisediminis]